MVWALDLDDFNGKLCTTSEERYPLMSLIKRSLEDDADTEDSTIGGGGNDADTSNDNTYTVVNNEVPEDTYVQVQPVAPPAQSPQQPSVDPNSKLSYSSELEKALVHSTKI